MMDNILLGSEVIMKHDILIFDLDGTISDPKDGIIKSINCALEYFDFESRSGTEISQFIGPPMDTIFESLTGITDPNLISSLVSKYRERYADVGYSENILYNGIRESLTTLYNNSESRLAICTSKRADFATKILDMFGLLELFDFVNGGDVGIEKWQQLGTLLERDQISRKSLMIGDRYIDLTAAHINNLNSAGVLWGYGSKEEIKQENPLYLFNSTQQLVELMV